LQTYFLTRDTTSRGCLHLKEKCREPSRRTIIDY
jgi:hypothetical protein